MGPRNDTHDATYDARNSGVNAAEDIFEDFLSRSGMNYRRFGFDEKKGRVENFNLMHPLLRHLPDFVFSKPGDKRNIYHTQVKGTNKFKITDYDMYRFYEKAFCEKMPGNHLAVAFCAVGYPTVIVPLRSISEVWETLDDEKFPSDGKVFRRLDVAKLSKMGRYDHGH